MQAFIRSFFKRYNFTYICIVLLLSILLLVLPEWVFAQTLNQWVSSVENDVFDLLKDDLGQVMTLLMKLLSWLWIVPASIAWELITNKFAFWTPFHFDRYLFTIRQFMRTMSFFILWLLLVGSIIKIYVMQEDIRAYWTLIWKTVWAGILISMSWFLLAWLVDLSIIWTTAVWSIPLSVMQDEFRNMQWKLICQEKIVVRNLWSLDELDIQESWTNHLTFEQIMPKWDSVSWPLIFIWCGLLNFFDLSRRHTWEDDIIVINTLQIIKLILVIMMIIPMLILMVVNIIRIFFIRLWAMFSPIVILDFIFKGPLTNGSSSLSTYFDPKNIIWLVFQPVLVVGAISIWLLFLMGIYDSNIWWQTFTEEAMQGTFNTFPIGTEFSKVWTWVLSEWYLIGSVINKWQTRVWWLISELILAFFSVFLFWTIVKVSLTSTSLTKQIAWSLYWYATQMLKAAPIIPIWWSRFGVWTIKNFAKDTFDQKTTGMLRQKRAMDADKLNQKFGVTNSNLLTNQEWFMLQEAIQQKGTMKMRTEMKKLQQNKAIDTTDSQFRQAVQKWILTNKNFIQGLNGLTDENIGQIWTGK